MKSAPLPAKSSGQNAVSLIVGSNKVYARSAARRLIPLLLLWLMFFAQLSSARQASPTYDEYEYIARGYTHLRTGDTHLKLRHPILLDMLAAVPLRLLPNLQLPLDHPSLAEGDFHVYARVFFWEANGALADYMIFLARLPVMGLSLLLAAAVFRWAGERFGLKAGLIAMTLCVFDPNILAHGRLVTPDVGQSTFLFLATFAWWRYLQRPGRLRLFMAGLTLGLAQAAGFPALILYPLLALVSLAWAWGAARPYLFRSLAALVAASMLSLVVVWSIYRFTWGPIEPGGIALPAPYHWQEFRDLLQRLDRQDLAFLRGEVYRGGRYSFFVVALLIKTPLPTLILAAWGFILLARRRTLLPDAALWLLPAFYYGNALVTSLNIGYRHILPVLPFAFVLAGSTSRLLTHVNFSRRPGDWRHAVLPGLLAWLMLASLSIYPFYLAYFNELAGGPLGGRRYLVVSDLDWGQDLPGLSAYLQRHGIDEVYLSYFGTTPPEHYGIGYRPIPAWPPRGNPQHYAFHPRYPLPGIYAISAANLEGARFEHDRDTFAWFWGQQPMAHIGYSIFIYQVPRLLATAAPPAHVALSGVTLAELPAVFIEEQLKTNDIYPRWFDGRRALILPAGHALILLGPETPLDQDLADRFLPHVTTAEQLSSAQGTLLDLYQLDTTAWLASYLQGNVQQHVYTTLASSSSLDDVYPLVTPLRLGSVADFLGYELLTAPIEPGAEVKLLTFWRVNQRSQDPLAFFVHLLAPDGSILGQHDGLDAPVDSWYPGDVIVQVHTFNAPAELPGGTRWLALGLYRSDTFERLPVVAETAPGIISDRVLLEVGE